ncbi:MAG: DUF4405 domain-containing protein [Melioribacteraceae bacterium]|nr:DUF4405 domain-containing protein [Melioribacteraceae bacterium]
MNKKQNKINWRAFISVYMGFSFIIMVISGLILYISPPGRIAHWSYWALFGLTKDEWQAVHTIFTFLFIAAGILHLIYNWKPLLNYLRRRTQGSVKIRKEMMLASLVSILIFVGAYIGVPPFGTVMDIGEEITDSWSNEENEPPIPHAERLTIAEFAKAIDMSTNKLEKILTENGYSVKDTLRTMEELAAEYNVRPNEIYNIVKLPANKNVQSAGGIYQAGSGFGRKKLSEIFSVNNISWDEGLEILKINGIKVESDGKVKDIAEKNNLIPSDIIKALGLI